MKEANTYILFLGPTGSGKSHMIDMLADTRGKRTSSGLQSYTSCVSTVSVEHGNASTGPKKIVLVDTPGFDDTYNSDMKTLEVISKWLRKMYKAGSGISGIVYLHRITDNRVSEAVHRNLHVFSELCGSHAFKNIVLATTMWDEIHSQGEGEAREVEFEKTLWAEMIHGGALVTRFMGSKDSAWKVVEEVLKASEGKQVVLSLQNELVKERKRLRETKAAQALYTPLSIILAHHARRYVEGENELRSVDDLRQEFEKNRQQAEELLEKFRMSVIQTSLRHKFIVSIRNLHINIKVLVPTTSRMSSLIHNGLTRTRQGNTLHEDEVTTSEVSAGGTQREGNKENPSNLGQ